ncbi:restriction endonuclease [Hansschlegelia zhihuaiae]|uniref:Restriction endonuclease type IV Mrr domain-containing protein n=1 Tax=Hansschlegelia zhihuaiae TaxID=405005 RepID=A0A4Q0M2L2_9HYPH|nr:restriction endonuclease [Hansschlegelia zhihuaiae]RXF66953.1 hypothetical protein EK403_21965 [Hansschlegelia zhihuaiae]
MISDSEFLERLVAGFCTATMEDADVSWDEKIGGRQFDVVIRLKAGVFNYLTIVEVKSSKAKIKVKEIEAFVTKAIDAKANKISVFSSKGFESGCENVARNHGVELFIISQSDETPSEEAVRGRLAQSGIYSFRNPNIDHRSVAPIIKFGERVKSHNFDKITLVYVTGEELPLTTEGTELTYVLSNSLINRDTFLRDIISNIDFPELEVGQSCEYTHKFSPSVDYMANDELFSHDGDLGAIKIKYSGIMAIPFEGNVYVELSMFASDVEIVNALTGEKSSIYFHNLALGFNEFEKGMYYFTLNPLSYYYCDEIIDSIATVYLLESFQNGRFLHGKFKQEIKYGRLYMPLKDKKVIERLKVRLGAERHGGPFARKMPKKRRVVPWR